MEMGCDGVFVNSAIANAKKPILMAKAFKKDLDKAREMSLNESEVAFYDALSDNNSAKELMGDELLVKIAREVAEKLRKNVTVDWNVMSALPDNKSFFYYEGSYPMPPCKPNWKWIIFEEVVEIGSTNFETFELVTKYSDTLGNIRIPTKPLGTRNVFYQNNPHLLANDKIDIENIKQQIKDLQDKQKNIEGRNEDKAQFEVEKDKTTETKLKIVEQNQNEFDTWYKEHKLFIKGILITIIMLCILFTGLKITKKIINEDILTNFITNELNKSEIREKEKAELEAPRNNMMGPPDNMGAPPDNNLGPNNL